MFGFKQKEHNTEGKFETVKYTREKGILVEMFLVNGKHIVAVVNDETNSVIKGVKNLTRKQAEKLYGQYCSEFGVGEGK